MAQLLAHVTDGSDPAAQHPFEASVALHFMTYNYVKIHGTLKTTPAVAAGLTPRPWQIKDVIEMLEERELPPE